MLYSCPMSIALNGNFRQCNSTVKAPGSTEVIQVEATNQQLRDVLHHAESGAERSTEHLELLDFILCPGHILKQRAQQNK